MLELRIINAGTALPLFDLPAMLGRREAAREIGDTIEGLIAFMDELGGDPDLEDSETGSNMVDATGRYLGPPPTEEQDEDRELSWPEWQGRGRHKLTPGGHEMRTHGLAGWQMTDDDEDDDPAEDDGEDCCEGGDDEPRAGPAPVYRAYGTSSTWIGSEDDAESAADILETNDHLLQCGTILMSLPKKLTSANDA